MLSSVCLDRRAKLYCLGSDIKIKSQKDGLLSYKGLNRNFLLADAPFLPHTFEFPLSAPQTRCGSFS
jgi:hypothetical protein